MFLEILFVIGVSLTAVSFIYYKFIYKPKTYITCDYVGGLGNQLFCIYTTISHALTYDKFPIFLYKNSVTNRPTYWNSLFKTLEVYDDISNINWKVINENKHDGTYTYSIKDKSQNICLRGYSQNYHNFYEHINIINFMLGIDERRKYIKIKYWFLFRNVKKILGIHFRIGDYKNIDNNVLPDLYYIEAIKQVSDFSDIYIFCEENDTNEVTQRIMNILLYLKIQKPFLVVRGKSDLDEMFILSHCHHIITANSTFSWWSAVYSKHQNVTIPSFSWYNNTSERLCLPNWKTIDI